MPTTKHKRKATAHHHVKVEKQPGMISSHPQAFIGIGVFCILLSIALLAFQGHDNAMFGIAMLSLVAGVVLTFTAKIALRKKNSH
ncbi:hypothetical protein [Thalassotalea sp. PLHSN55]|uniref:hypothetical protein n=1 Tax=Thalassotalea sp. PLHSN55 TaxID=3435888 RepID=UPI003F87E360